MTRCMVHLVFTWITILSGATLCYCCLGGFSDVNCSTETPVTMTIDEHSWQFYPLPHILENHQHLVLCALEARMQGYFGLHYFQGKMSAVFAPTFRLDLSKSNIII